MQVRKIVGEEVYEPYVDEEGLWIPIMNSKDGMTQVYHQLISWEIIEKLKEGRDVYSR